jgi:hypothetical protein
LADVKTTLGVVRQQRLRHDDSVDRGRHTHVSNDGRERHAEVAAQIDVIESTVRNGVARRVGVVFVSTALNVEKEVSDAFAG